jgi:hypothetical protein
MECTMTVQEQRQAAETYYADAIDRLIASGLSFMVGGAYAMRQYAGVVRDTKDLDVFCLPGDHPELLEVLADAGYRPEITDATWLAKAFRDDHYVDIIFGSGNGACTVDDTWFEHAPRGEILGRPVQLVPPEEILWTKMLVEERHRFDGADVNHLLRTRGTELDWKRVLRRMEPYWEILFSHVLQFRFVYPAERAVVPDWLLEELMNRLAHQMRAPVPLEKVCRGPLLSKHQYEIDIREWGYTER